jgi:hypothetical protein
MATRNRQSALYPDEQLAFQRGMADFYGGLFEAPEVLTDLPPIQILPEFSQNQGLIDPQTGQRMTPEGLQQISPYLGSSDPTGMGGAAMAVMQDPNMLMKGLEQTLPYLELFQNPESRSPFNIAAETIPGLGDLAQLGMAGIMAGRRGASRLFPERVEQFDELGRAGATPETQWDLTKVEGGEYVDLGNRPDSIRAEINDSTTKLKTGNMFSFGRNADDTPRSMSGELGEILELDDLYTAYPGARELDVTFFPDEGVEIAGGFDPNTNALEVAIPRERFNKMFEAAETRSYGAAGGQEDLFPEDLDMVEEDILGVLKHEVQHYVQKTEGTATGGNPDQFINLAGARKVNDEASLIGGTESAALREEGQATTDILNLQQEILRREQIGVDASDLRAQAEAIKNRMNNPDRVFRLGAWQRKRNKERYENTPQIDMFGNSTKMQPSMRQWQLMDDAEAAMTPEQLRANAEASSDYLFREGHNTAYGQYRRLTGEMEANNVGDVRSTWSQGQRDLIPPSQTADWTRPDRGDPIFEPKEWRAPRGSRSLPARPEDIGQGAEDLLGLTEDSITKWRSNQTRNPFNQDPMVQRAAKAVNSGELTSKEFREVVAERLPITPIETMPAVPTFDELTSALNPKQRKNIVGLNMDVEDGARVASRLDIPAYRDYDTWVVSLHDGTKGGTAGASLGYGKTAVLDNVEFGTVPRVAQKIAAGETGKSTIARAFGSWRNMDSAEVAEMARRELANPNSEWVQVGMNPYRGSAFVDKATGEPLRAAEEVIQVGPLMLARGVRRTDYDNPMFTVPAKEGKNPKPYQF